MRTNLKSVGEADTFISTFLNSYIQKRLEDTMKKLLAIILALSMLLSLVACGEEKEPEVPEYKTELTDQSLTYTLDELESLAAETHYISDYELPALYKYFEGLVDIGVAFTSNQMYDFNAKFSRDESGLLIGNDMVATGILKHYNMYVLGNELKSDHCNPAEGVYNFDNADEFVEIGRAAGAKLRGHTIVWHSQVPQWWFKADPNDTSSLADCRNNGTLATREQLIERVTTYIGEVIGRYKDDIKYWDVCNEVLNASGIRSYNDDQSLWAEIIGDVDGNGYLDDYVEIAFNAAREAGGEDVVLMINDFNMEWQNSKTNAMYDMVERMLRKGVRIDGVGFQSHISVDCNVELYRQNIAKIAGLAEVYDECFPEHKGNFRVQITELDMNMFVGANSDGAFYAWEDSDYERQAEKYAELMDMFLDFADEGVIDAILFWGTDDENSWLNTFPKLRRNAALLADRDMVIKPCFWSIAKTSFDHK